MNQENFLLKYLKCSNILFDDLEINFVNQEIHNNNNYINVLIGSNGVGKTQLLLVLSSIFIELEKFKNSNKVNYNKNTKNYTIVYQINETLFSIEKKYNKIICHCNDNEIDVKDILLPNKILACSFLIGDKFLYKNSGIYTYLGIKESATLTSTTAIGKKVAINIIENSDKEEFIYGIRKGLEFIGVQSEVKISYKLKLKDDIFHGNLTENEFIEVFKKKLSSRTTQPFWKKKYDDIVKNKYELQGLIESINQIALDSNNKGNIVYEIDLSNALRNKTIKSILEYLNILVSLDLLSAPKLLLKGKEDYEFNESSSGESHLIFLITNILAYIKNNTLLLIDEPEISLHPSWIIKFTNLINEITKIYNGCHVIIATHSHFILSDLPADNTGLIIMSKDDGRVKVKCESSYTYGWSAENILYRVFNVPSNRNYYLADELDEILNQIAIGEYEKVKGKVKMLRQTQLNLTDSDPLKLIIKKIIDRMKDYDEPYTV